MTRKKARQTIAYHEAGHAVVARLLGIGVPFITMVPHGHGDAMTLTESALYAARNGSRSEREKSCEIDLKILMAATVAQNRHERGDCSGYLDAALRDGDDDSQISRDVINHFYFLTGREPPVDEVELPADDLANIHALEARLWGETELLVSDYWPAIERVAEALTVRDFLDQAELDALIANNRSRTRLHRFLA